MPSSAIRLVLFAALCGAPGAVLAAEGAPVRATLLDNQQEEIGTATFTDGPNGVLIEVEVTGLTEGWHGIHLHAVGDCADAAFKNAGAHVNMHERAHGLMNPEGPDEGDLPSIYAGSDGTAHAQLFNWRVALSDGASGRADLMDADGSALVIHAQPDDQVTQPIGNAGDRVACGVLTKTGD